MFLIFAQGELVYNVEIPLAYPVDCYMVFTNDNNVNKVYYYLSQKVDSTNYANIPVVIAGTWEVNNDEILVQLDEDSDMSRLYFKIDGTNLSVKCIEGTVAYTGTYINSSVSTQPTQFVLTTVGEDKVAYIKIETIEDPDTGAKAYSYKGTWALVTIGEHEYIQIYINGYTYRYEIPTSGTSLGDCLKVIEPGVD